MINKDVEDLRKCIVSRLSRFVSSHIPSNKGSLFPGVHWVWDSFQYLLPKLCAVVILSGHSVTGTNLSHCTHTETLLRDRSKFLDLDTIDHDMDGNYIVFDSTRKYFIRSGCAEVGIKRRWKEHLSASKLTTSTSRNSSLYMSYPHKDTKKEKLSTIMCRGVFQQLQPLIGVGLLRSKSSTIMSLFDPDINSKNHVTKLNGVGDRNGFEEKWYRHICYCFECLYAIMIDVNTNISTNPGFEWQLKFYGSE